MNHLPVQLCPFPEYPVLQVQLYDPLVLLQTAFKSQMCGSFLHSSVSEIFEENAFPVLFLVHKSINGNLLWNMGCVVQGSRSSKIFLASDKVQGHFTFARLSISGVSSFARANIWSFGIITHCIGTTFVGSCPAFVDIYNTELIVNTVITPQKASSFFEPSHSHFITGLSGPFSTPFRLVLLSVADTSWRWYHRKLRPS